MRNMVDYSFADLCLTIKWSHVRFRPSFVDENESFEVNDFLELLPFCPFKDDICSMPFESAESLFFVSSSSAAETYTMLRKLKLRSMPELWKKLGKLCEVFSPDECKKYFKNAGYKKSKRVQTIS